MAAFVPIDRVLKVFGPFGGQLKPCATELYAEAMKTAEPYMDLTTPNLTFPKHVEEILCECWRALNRSVVTHVNLGAVYGKDSSFLSTVDRRMATSATIAIERMLEDAGYPIPDDRIDTFMEQVVSLKVQPFKGGDLDFDTLIPLPTATMLRGSPPKDDSMASYESDHELRFIPHLALTGGGDGMNPGFITFEHVNNNDVIVMMFPNTPVFDTTTQRVLVETHYLRTTSKQLEDEATDAFWLTHVMMTPQIRVRGVSKTTFASIADQLERNKAQVSLRCVASRRRAHGFWELYKEDISPAEKYPADVTPANCYTDHGYSGFVKKKKQRAFAVSFLVFESGILTPKSVDWANDTAVYLTEKRPTAVDLKNKGNEEYGKKQYLRALQYYALAIRRDDFICGASESTAADSVAPTLYSNSAVCLLSMKEYKMAVRLSSKGLSCCPFLEGIDKIHEKLIFRRATALIELGNVNRARIYLKIIGDSQEAKELLARIEPKKPKPPKKPKKQAASTLSLDDPASWANGLNEEEQMEWLVDCYRMRLDDEYVYRGNIKGLYGGQDPDLIVFDFIVFAKLCVKHAVIPPGWDWGACLRGPASRLLKYAFEKSDAQKKYGSENVFAAALGGRSLRFVGLKVYNSDVNGSSTAAENDLLDEVEEYDEDIEQAAESGYLDDIGGGDAWIDLFEALGGEVGGSVLEPPPPEPPARTKPAKQFCRFFARGNCLNGADCRFSHEM
eukprot:TRINITY_DN22776_c0_g1_i1.p1 TRINITY_DN22776_c0_g1~~TRINITY_DN22776_c0_g1_i1.p1  ORF type:complete len:784 (+),score=138.48 TRINITY_DN22776_c0_g1_i1:165-2354(+)